MSFNLKSAKSLHFTGIKGVGMASLALCFKDLGKKITGSDTDEIFPTDKVLKKANLKFKPDFNPKNIPSTCDLLIYTGAHGGQSNPEVIEAQKRNIPVLPHAKALGLLSQSKKTLAVAGIGGKSTTSAMLAVILDSAGFKPSFAVGVGSITDFGNPGKFDKKSDYFVVEADEFITDPQANPTPRFHYLNPYVAIITNLEHDHPDVYPSIDSIYQAFEKFVSFVPKDGAVIVNIDNPRVKIFVSKLKRKVITYGFSPMADWQIIKHHLADKKQFFTLKVNGVTWPEFILNQPGKYNLLNATAAIAASYHIGVPVEKLKPAIKKFQGTKRRFEFIKSIKGIDLYDDYAHHPTEIEAVLKAAKDWLPGKRIIPIFQSHTFSRTKVLLDEFTQSFNSASLVVINDIFPSAREKKDPDISGQILTQKIKNHQPNTFYCKGKSQTMEFISTHIRQGDVIITLGAGNNFLWHKDILKTIKNL